MKSIRTYAEQEEAEARRLYRLQQEIEEQRQERLMRERELEREQEEAQQKRLESCEKPDPNTYDRLIRVFHDGELWRAQSSSQPEGMEGFGPTIAEALRKLADEWEQYGFELAPREENHE